MLPPARLIHLRPNTATLYVAQGRTVFASGRDGFIHPDSPEGLFVHETRLLSDWRYAIDGRAPEPVALSNVAGHTWRGYYVTAAPGVEPAEIDMGSGLLRFDSQQTLELVISRFVGGGVHEDIDLTNYSLQSITFDLSLDFDADFADIVETRRPRQQRGVLRGEWNGDRFEFEYAASHGDRSLRRGVRLTFAGSLADISRRSRRIVFRIALGPRGSWHTCVDLVPLFEGKPVGPQYGCHAFREAQTELDTKRAIFMAESTTFSTPESSTRSHIVTSALQQAAFDLAALRLPDLDLHERAWTMAAGWPMYVALFGRDSLTAGWQAGLVNTAMMEGTLPVLARLQGTREDEWRDEQPGRMLHEAHTGPLPTLGFDPRERYYGSVTTSGFFPFVVSELWHWTGDLDLVRPLVPAALKALRWLDREADIDRDGFYEYHTRSPGGVKHQGWKDSPDAIVMADGSPVDPPIATCEEQAFAYAAKFQLSELLWWLGERDEARRMYQQASDLKQRFNERFWMEDARFLAMGLGPHKQHIDAIGSNAGHCLAAGLIDTALAADVARRLMAPDLFSGWGIRTLSAGNPAFNPYSYHRGSVWPVEQATFALGFMRYGLHDLVERLTAAQFDAAALFDAYRLPEVFSGHPRDADHPFPAIYPQACSPQAWSSSAVFCHLQALLGCYPYAPLKVLLLDPHLPEWLPEITVHNLKVGAAITTIRFRRHANGVSDYDVLDVRGTLHILRQPSPWSLTASFAERVRDAISSVLPH